LMQIQNSCWLLLAGMSDEGMLEVPAQIVRKN
jgi:hypothetical protein